MNPHLEVLGRQQRQVLARIGPSLTARGYYLAEGTAVALHLGHRRSVDLDWFTRKPMRDPLVLARQLQSEGIRITTEDVGPGTLHGTISGVRVSFLEYGYRLLQPVILWRDSGCTVASRADLAAMKLAAIAQRGAKKDFVDIYALGRRRMPIGAMLQWYRQKYAVTDTAHLLMALAFFDDADRERMPRMLWDSDWHEVKRTIRNWLRQLVIE